jgi:hypothetical protein
MRSMPHHLTSGQAWLGPMICHARGHVDARSANCLCITLVFIAFLTILPHVIVKMDGIV